MFSGEYMGLAIELARSVIGAEVPVGAVIVGQDGSVIASGKNQMVAKCDPTAHAEIEAIRAACAVLGDYRLPGCAMFVTLEPCPMCISAIGLARIDRLYIGARSTKGRCNHVPEVYDCIMEQECSGLLDDFFAPRR